MLFQIHYLSFADGIQGQGIRFSNTKGNIQSTSAFVLKTTQGADRKIRLASIPVKSYPHVLPENNAQFN